jgi:hypothetical protein
MSEGKYGDLFVEKPLVEGKFAPRLVFFSRTYVGEKDFSVLMNCITEPYLPLTRKWSSPSEKKGKSISSQRRRWSISPKG